MVVVVWIARSVELPCQLFPLLFEAMFDAAAAAGTVEAVLATSAVGIEAGAEASQFAPPYYTAAFPSLLELEGPFSPFLPKYRARCSPPDIADRVTDYSSLNGSQLSGKM